MHKMFRFLSPALTILTVLSIAALSACSTIKGSAYHSYQQEEFTSKNVYAHSFAGSEQATCEAARRALLSQGYVISEATKDAVKGRKNFQPENDVHMQIQFNVVCAPNSKGSNSTTAFANAVRDRYSLKKSSNSASVGVGVLGSLSVPFGSTDDSLVKVGSETIPTRQFYERFFELVESYLDPGASVPDDGSEKKRTSPANTPDAADSADSTDDHADSGS